MCFPSFGYYCQKNSLSALEATIFCFGKICNTTPLLSHPNGLFSILLPFSLAAARAASVQVARTVRAGVFSEPGTGGRCRGTRCALAAAPLRPRAALTRAARGSNRSTLCGGLLQQLRSQGLKLREETQPRA